MATIRGSVQERTAPRAAVRPAQGGHVLAVLYRASEIPPVRPEAPCCADSILPDARATSRCERGWAGGGWGAEDCRGRCRWWAFDIRQWSRAQGRCLGCSGFARPRLRRTCARAQPLMLERQRLGCGWMRRPAAGSGLRQRVTACAAGAGRQQSGPCAGGALLLTGACGPCKPG